uniref:Uncharacterized protein n=1 Tax=Oxyrrhis marina TaxID=2969 RepID=A0A7S4GLU1_OXYMA|mmetsp:Transcript_62804/g.168508  ORF Transcript_62804/g.168508 Transcript_62804/m.168508 type:complete len:232 (+) Transcript_62804:90-785(+)
MLRRNRPPQMFRNVKLQELPFAYSSKAWAMVLTFRTATTVPEGKIWGLIAPRPFEFADPALVCDDDDEDKPSVGSPLFRPPLPQSPFRSIDHHPPAANAGDAAAAGTYRPSSAGCRIDPVSPTDTRELLEVLVLDGTVPAGLYEFRFTLEIEPLVVLPTGAVDLPSTADLRWELRTWTGVVDQASDGTCPALPEANGMPLDYGLLYDAPQGRWRDRQVVLDDFGEWTYSDA